MVSSAVQCSAVHHVKEWTLTVVILFTFKCIIILKVVENSLLFWADRISISYIYLGIFFFVELFRGILFGAAGIPHRRLGSMQFAYEWRIFKDLHFQVQLNTWD